MDIHANFARIINKVQCLYGKLQLALIYMLYMIYIHLKQTLWKFTGSERGFETGLDIHRLNINVFVKSVNATKSEHLDSGYCCAHVKCPLQRFTKPDS